MHDKPGKLPPIPPPPQFESGSTYQCATRKFLAQGKFDSYYGAVVALGGWLKGANAAGYCSNTLAAWITIGDKVRVQLATRAYWKDLTPRGPARQALARVDADSALLCLVFRRGQVESAALAELVLEVAAEESVEPLESEATSVLSFGDAPNPSVSAAPLTDATTRLLTQRVG